MQNYYKAGLWNVICDICGKKMKSDEALKRWDGAIVCKNDWEQRNPLDFIRGRDETNRVPYTRPEQTDIFVGPSCTSTGVSATAGYAVAGCMIAGLIVSI